MRCEKCRGYDLQTANDDRDYFCRSCGQSSTQIRHELAQAQIGLARNLPNMVGGGVAQRVMQAAAVRQAAQTGPRPQGFSGMSADAARDMALPSRYRKP